MFSAPRMSVARGATGLILTFRNRARKNLSSRASPGTLLPAAAVPSSLTELFQSLADRGERLTRTRRAVLETLAAAGGPMSVRALHQSVGPRRVDLVTVYRTLHWLEELGAARAVLTGGAAELFELALPGEHTHHLLCDECGAVATVPVCGVDPAVAGRIEREHGFRVSHHRLTYHGRCRECAERGG